MTRFFLSPWRPALLALLALAGVALGAGWALRALAASVQTYHPLPAVQAARPVPLPNSTVGGEGVSPLVSPPTAPHVILVVVSGLRADTARRLPTLADLGQRGARAEVQVTPPTGLLATWGTLLTGAGPTLGGAPLLDHSLAASHPLQADTLLLATRRAGLPATLFGRGSWESLLPDEKVQGVAPTGFSMAAGTDQATTDAAREAWRQGGVGLSIVNYRLVELVGAAFGTDSPEYERAALTVDGQLAQLTKDLNLRRVVLVVTADRGLTDAGRAGGDEREVTTVPFVAVGVGVRLGEYGVVSQADIAPTLAAWLGIEPPTQAQGLTRGEMLQVPDGTRAQRGLADAAQKLGLEGALVGALGTARDRQTVAEELAGLPTIRTSMELGNDVGAWKLAEATARESQRRLAALEERALDAQAMRRLLPCLLALAGLCLAVVWRISLRRVVLLLAALAAWLLPLGGLVSFAPTPTWGGWPWAVLLAFALAVGGGLAHLWRTSDSRATRLNLVGVVGLALLAWTLWRGPTALSLSDITMGGDIVRLALGQAAQGLAWGLLAVLALAWATTEGATPTEVATWAGEYALLLAGVLTAEAAILVWQVGLTLAGVLPALGPLLLQAQTLARLAAVGLGGLLLPWLAALVHLAATWQPAPLEEGPMMATKNRPQ